MTCVRQSVLRNVDKTYGQSSKRGAPKWCQKWSPLPTQESLIVHARLKTMKYNLTTHERQR